MLKKILMLTGLLIIVSSSCWSEKSGDANMRDKKELEEKGLAALDLDTFNKTESGLMYKIHNEANASKEKFPSNGEMVTVHYTGWLEDGTKFDSSYDRNEPIEFELGIGRVIKGWDEGILLLRKGQSATMVIPPDLAYGSTNRGPIPANSTLIFDVELVDFKPAPKIETFDIEGKVVSTTDSGLKFILVEEGSGKKAAPGNNVSVHYSGYLEDGSMFDSSLKRNIPFQFTLGMGRVIKGWDEGIALMKVGDKARLIIPPELGYGKNGTGPIPPNSTLIFDVELLEIK